MLSILKDLINIQGLNMNLSLSTFKIKPDNYLFAKFLLVLFIFVIAGCAVRPTAGNNPYYEIIDTQTVKMGTTQNSDYRILPGDEIQIKFLFHPNFNELLEVMPDGKISLPLIHGVTVIGKTPSQLAEELENTYAKELKNPDIVVNVRRSTGSLVYVGGEVKTPQALNIKTPTTISQALISCGGINLSAEISNLIIIRSQSGSSAKILLVNLDKIRQGLLPDIFLQPYDVVHVPQSRISEVETFVDQYINNIIPKNIQLLFTYEIRSDINK
jgi:protein involved in polysaccharide export with SLBB domain